MKPLEASIDRYGTHARASNLADYVELLALQGVTMARVGLAQEIVSNQWLVKLKELFAQGPIEKRSDFDESDEPEDVVPDQPGFAEASRVFDLLDQRIDVLGDRYPFEAVEDTTVPDGTTHSLQLRAGLDFKNDPYVGLLCITAAHAYKLPPKPDPKRVLEGTVTRALVTLGLDAVNVGELSRVSKNFRETVQRSGVALGLQPNPGAAMSYANANEEGVDCLGRLAGVDMRAGDWVFLGQVTCAMSDRWSAKLAEPKPQDWMQYLNTYLKPQRFLAVPHHVEDDHLVKLVGGGEGQVLDRLRLVMFLDCLTKDEVKIVDAVVSSPILSQTATNRSRAA